MSIQVKLDRIAIAGKVRTILPHAIDDALALCGNAEVPNGDALFELHRAGLRQHLLELVAALDSRPAAALLPCFPSSRPAQGAGR